MNTIKITIYYPNRPGFIMLSNDMKLLFQHVFEHDTELVLHGGQSFKIMYDNVLIHRSENVDPDSMDKRAIINQLSKFLNPVNTLTSEDLNGGKVSEQELEPEWKYALCSGE